MKDIDEIRRENMRLIEREVGGTTEAAALCGMSPSQFANLRDGAKDSKTGKPRGMRKETARRIEECAKKPSGWMDTDHQDPTHGTANAPTPSMQPILAWEHPEDLPEGEFVLIPRLGVHLSAGHGCEQVEIELLEKQPQAFRADWIRKKHLQPKKLASMTADGDSMEERIQHGDALVVDTSQTDVMDGKVYALWYDGGERVKRLYRLPGGVLRIQSDNPKHPTIEVPASEMEHVRIIGRVVHVSGEGGL